MVNKSSLQVMELQQVNQGAKKHKKKLVVFAGGF
jgi:hypothetical protein